MWVDIVGCWPAREDRKRWYSHLQQSFFGGITTVGAQRMDPKKRKVMAATIAEQLHHQSWRVRRKNLVWRLTIV